MTTIIVLDYFLNKHFALHDVPEDIAKTIQQGDKIIYLLDEKGIEKESIGTALGFSVDIERSAKFVKKMNPEEEKDFMQQQEFALKVFPVFKKKFKEAFPTSKPITARYNPLLDQIYFYFYSEERYIFGDLVRELKEELGKSIFLFQVGARDMMRIDPNSKDYAVGSDCGMQFACQGLGVLPSVEVEAVALQGLEGRDIERLKGRCGKLKCSLLYELDIYLQEGKHFPCKGTTVSWNGSTSSGVVSSYNIITKEVVIKTEEGAVLRIPVAMLKNEKNIASTGEKKNKDCS